MAMELCIGARNLSGHRTLDAGAESTLVDRCRKQDVEAFGRLVDVYQNRVFGFVRRMVPNPDEAADVTQEVFIKAFQNFPKFDGRSALRTWLFRIAYHLCVDRSRKTARSIQEVSLINSNDGDDIDVQDDRWQPDQLILDDELFALLDDAIAAMSEKLKSVLLLHDREDMSYDEIAQLLGVPVGTVKSRLFLARAHLQNALGNYLHGGGVK